MLRWGGWRLARVNWMGQANRAATCPRHVTPSTPGTATATAHLSPVCSATLFALLSPCLVSRRESETHVVSLALRADLAAESDGGALALDGLAFGVNVGDGDLNRGVVLGRDQAVWRRWSAKLFPVGQNVESGRTPRNRARAPTAPLPPSSSSPTLSLPCSPSQPSSSLHARALCIQVWPLGVVSKLTGGGTVAGDVKVLHLVRDTLPWSSRSCRYSQRAHPCRSLRFCQLRSLARHHVRNAPILSDFEVGEE